MPDTLIDVARNLCKQLNTTLELLKYEGHTVDLAVDKLAKTGEHPLPQARVIVDADQQGRAEENDL